MTADFTLDYLAVLRTSTDLSRSGYKLEFLYSLYNKNKGAVDWLDTSKKILSDPRLDRVIICHETVMKNDYAVVKDLLEKGEILPDDISVLLK